MTTRRLSPTLSLIVSVALLTLASLSSPGAAAQAPAPGGPAQETATAAATETPVPATASATPSPAASAATTAAKTATATATSPPGPDERPFLVLMASSASPSRPAAGTTFQLDLRVANMGDVDARRIQLTLTSDTFLAVDGGSSLFEDKIRDDEDETLSVLLTVVDAASPGVHAIAVAMRYEDGDGNAYADQATVGVEVAASAQLPVVVVQAVRMPSRVAPGIPFTMAVDLTNTGAQPAANVVVAPAVGPLALQGGGNTAPVSLPPGGLATVTLRLVAASPQAPGAASQTLDIRFTDPTGQAHATTHVVGLVITGGAATDPLPMVTGYSAGDRLGLHPGQVFELVLEVTNVGAVDAWRTLLALGGGTAPAASSGAAAAAGGSSGASLGVFAPLDTSNLRFLGHLSAGGTTTVRQRLVVDGAAKPGPYVLEVNLSYVDANGQALANTEVISLVVTRPVDLAITATNPITSTVVGEPLPFPVEVLNRGANTVTVTEVAVNGPAGMRIVDGSRFVGELDSGASDTLEPVITADAEGTVAITATARYLDDLNNEHLVTETFTLTVTAAPLGLPAPEQTAADGGNLLLRILKGFLGLGASPPLDTAPPDTLEPIRSDGPMGQSGTRGGAAVRAAPARR